MTLPSDPLEALRWALNHTDAGWWLIGLVGAGIAWSSKRMREWRRRNALLTGPATKAAAPAGAAATQASTYTAAPSYAAAGYTAQPAYAAPPPQPPHGKVRTHRDSAPPPQRVVAPVARSVDVPVSAASGSWTLAGAFGDPTHARTAIVVAEVLGPPVGLR